MASGEALIHSEARPAFMARIKGTHVLIEGDAARDMLGVCEGDLLSPRPLVASLTGRCFVEEIADLAAQPGTYKVLPALLFGSEYRVIPAMLECHAHEGEILMRATEVGNSDVVRRGFIDAERLLKAAIEAAPGSIITIDELGAILSFNNAAELAFGYTAAEIIGSNVAALMNLADAGEHDAHLRRYLHTGERHIIGSMRVAEARRKDGRIFPVELYISEVRVGDRRLYAGFLRDISNRRELQAETATLQRELIHVTRLASMGEMAAALAHELNQPLTAIAAYAETARLQLNALSKKEPSPAEETLAKVSAQALRAGEIIRRMRQLATGGAGQRDPEDINALAREAMTLAAVGAKALAIETRFIEGQAIPAVACDRIQVQQVIINLVRNAIDAFADAPHDHNRAAKRLIILETEADKQRVMVSVRDTGPGVPPELRDRLFESFLTTKDMGVGLGLPVSRMIIESHGGKLWFEEASEDGALFRFTLPLQGVRARS
jgi:two-component system sensor kinase FixL